MNNILLSCNLVATEGVLEANPRLKVDVESIDLEVRPRVTFLCNH